MALPFALAVGLVGVSILTGPSPEDDAAQMLRNRAQTIGTQVLAFAQGHRDEVTLKRQEDTVEIQVNGEGSFGTGVVRVVYARSGMKIVANDVRAVQVAEAGQGRTLSYKITNEGLPQASVEVTGPDQSTSVATHSARVLDVASANAVETALNGVAGAPGIEKAVAELFVSALPSDVY